MPAITFSLTEKGIIHPVLTLRAPLSPLEPGQTVGWAATIWQGIQSELIARVAAVFTSAFAAADALIHLATGVCKGISLLAGANYSKSAVYGHFRQAARFSLLTVVGSIASVIWPGVLKYCLYSPPPPSDSFDAPPSLQELATAVQRGDQQAPFDQLRQFWRQSSLEEKRLFVQVFNGNNESFAAVRRALAGTVYQSVSSLKNRQVSWLSAEEVNGTRWDRTTTPFFFHATSEGALEPILKSKKVEVRHEKEFRGAFVSSRPETGFGRCILAFNRNIERLSPLAHGFPVNTSYWAGFSRDIPVTDSTLVCIMLERGTEEECNAMGARCQQWTGRSIRVIPLEEEQQRLEAVQRLGMGIPSEWPSNDGGRMSQMILKTLQARAAIAGQTTAPRVGQQMMLATG